MITNTAITIYHKRYNSNTRLDEWDIYPIKNAMWQGGKGASLNKGYEKANDVSIWLPYSKNKKLSQIPISIGDIIVKGETKEKILKQSDIKVDNYNITTLIDNNYGSPNMQHIFIGAK